jgi:hypothetical protein
VVFKRRMLDHEDLFPMQQRAGMLVCTLVCVS